MSENPRAVNREYLRADGLRVNQDVQRALDGGRVEKLAKAWDSTLLGVIEVSFRGGFHYVMDGQTRVAATVSAGHPEYLMAANVHYGLTVQDEGVMFLGFNNTKAPQPLDKFRVQVVAGDSEAVDCDKLIRAVGMVAGPSGVTAFRPVSALLALYRKSTYGPTAAEDTLEMLTRAWGSRSEAVSSSLIVGVGNVLHHYRRQIDHADLAHRLGRYPGGANAMIGAARGLRDSAGYSVGNAVSINVVNLYNLRRKEQTRIPSWTTVMDKL